MASFGCALSTSLNTLALARVVQGFGAAGVMSVNTALVRMIYPPAQLGRGVAINAMVVAVSSAVGPTIATANANTNTLGTPQATGLAAAPEAAKYKGTFKASTIVSVISGLFVELTLLLLPSAPSPLQLDTLQVDGSAQVSVVHPSLSSRMYMHWPMGHSGDPNTNAMRFMNFTNGSITQMSDRPDGASVGIAIPGVNTTTRKLTRPGDWQEAWFHYTDIACSIPALSHLRQMFNIYGYEVGILMNHFPFLAVLQFDRRFRALRTNFRSLDLDHAGPAYIDLHAATLTHRMTHTTITPGNHAPVGCAPATPQPDTKPAAAAGPSARRNFTPARPAAPAGTDATQDVCRNWNGDRCHRPNCIYAHRCSTCGSPDHPQSRHGGGSAPKKSGKGSGRSDSE